MNSKHVHGQGWQRLGFWKDSCTLSQGHLFRLCLFMSALWNDPTPIPTPRFYWPRPQRSPTFPTLQTGGGRGCFIVSSGKVHACAQLHLHEQQALTAARHTNGSSCTCTCPLLAEVELHACLLIHPSTARFWTGHGPVVDHSPRVGDPCTRQLGGSKNLSFLSGV